jgi:hypothetical protein
MESRFVFLKNLHEHGSAVRAVVILAAIVVAIALTTGLQHFFYRDASLSVLAPVIGIPAPTADSFSERQQLGILDVLAAAHATTTAQDATTTPISPKRQDALLDTMARSRSGDSTVSISETEKVQLLNTLATPQNKKI